MKMGRIEDELIVRERLMNNLLLNLEKIITFFEIKTVTDIFVYGSGSVHVSDFE